MKPSGMKSLLVLNKQTISNLNRNAMNNLRGGCTTPEETIAIKPTTSDITRYTRAINCNGGGGCEPTETQVNPN